MIFEFDDSMSEYARKEAYRVNKAKNIMDYRNDVRAIHEAGLNDDIRDRKCDSLLVLCAAKNKLLLKQYYKKEEIAIIDLREDAVPFGDTIYVGVRPDLHFLNELCEDEELVYKYKDGIMIFKNDKDNEIVMTKTKKKTEK